MRGRSIVLTGLLLFPAAMCPAAEFHVAPAGNDANAGSSEKPFATLARAQAAARQAKGGIVTVHSGTFYLPATLAFTPEDSGTEYRSADEGPVIISGGIRLRPAWTPHRDGILRAKLPPGAAIDQLFVNGRRQPMARYPNFDPKARHFGGAAADAIGPQRVAGWRNPAGGFVHALHPAAWGGVHYRITGTNEKGEVALEGGWQNNRGSGMHERLRYVENVLEELDALGEWYHDAKSATLYFHPPDDVDLETATIECDRLKHLVEFRGTPQRPVKHVVLRGFTFRQAARTFMETTEPLLRSDWTIYRGGAVLFRGAEDCTVADCGFDQLGGNAVFLSGYNRRVTIRGCDFHDTGASCVAFVGDPRAVRNPLFGYRQNEVYEKLDTTPGPLTDDYPADCVVEDCLLRGIGVVEKQAAGVQISMASAITVRQCSIYDASRAGINIGDGCWGGHVVEFCDVFDTVKETGDHGSFNAWGRDRYWVSWPGPPRPVDELPKLALLDAVRPTVLRNNRWRCDHGWDVDLDDGASNYEIHDNVFLNGGLKLREGFHRRVWNNVTVPQEKVNPHHPNTFHPACWYHKDQEGISEDVVVRNIWSAPYSRAFMCRGRWGKEMDYNLFSGVSAEQLEGYRAEHGIEAHSLLGDPMFIDPLSGDYRVRDGSPALTLGFKNFPMDRFGVRKPELRKIARTPQLPGKAIVAAPVASPPAVPAAPSARNWQGARIRDIGGQEYSAFGVAEESGGVHLADVPLGSAAARDGFQTDDLIQSLGGTPVRCLADLFRLHNDARGAPLHVGFVRGQQPRTAQVERYAFVVAETVPAVGDFRLVPLAPAGGSVAIRKIETQPNTNNAKPETLSDGALAFGYGPVFGNGVRGGLYKVDLGRTVDIAEINTWSCHFENVRGPQRFTVYGSKTAEGPIGDLTDRKHFTPIAEVDTTGVVAEAHQATSIRTARGASLGTFRWLIWQVQPVTAAGVNTAMQEFQIRATDPVQEP